MENEQLQPRWRTTGWRIKVTRKFIHVLPVAVASDKEEKTMTQSAGAALGMVFLPAVEVAQFSQQGNKPVSSDAAPAFLGSYQGTSAAISAGGNTAIVGEAYDSTLPSKVSV
jgi:hypothetical protein